MNIIVCVKEAVDLEQVRVNESTREPTLEGLPLEIEDLSKNAAEEAVRQKEQHGGTVVALAAGLPTLKKTIREVLAMGVDEARLVLHPSLATTDPPSIARILARAILQTEDYGLVLLGEGSADNFSGLVGPIISETLGLPGVTGVRELKIQNGVARCTRDLEDCYEVVEVLLPAVITVTSEINEPRLPSLTDVLKSSRKPVTELQDLGLKEENRTRRVKNIAPPSSRKGVLFQGEAGEAVKSLLEALRRDGVLT
ncbi:MAG: electron transfer flavoprotein subunit beta/FixA family protein [Chloroflexi bacterium]|nr:electron transfer flavoprotein subunit beta/FixA family protein [Chloroflexota bacterium]